MNAEVKTDPTREARLPLRSITLRYYCVWGFYSFAPSFIFAIYPLFLRSRGLNQLQVNTVAATYFLVTFLTDVPTGAFADAIGRRISVVLGCALHAAAFILYFYSYHYWHFIAAEILDGVATTFGNGAIDAWAVDALDACRVCADQRAGGVGFILMDGPVRSAKAFSLRA